MWSILLQNEVEELLSMDFIVLKFGVKSAQIIRIISLNTKKKPQA